MTILDSDGELDITPQAEPEVTATPEAETKVRVLAPFQVVHDGIAYLPGEVAEVPEHVATRWITNEWVAGDGSQ